MSSPIWMASPPEVHSASLSAGPGPGSLLAAAGAWTSLSTEYASAAAELSGLLGAVQAGAWQGPSAELYVAAHVPYLAWLEQASADSAGVAAQHEVAAAAYTSALAVMPTLAELAVNHLIHGVLVATNFFGINTIPIALNEADYARMWVQAATAMSTYQATSGAALASAPRTTPAPSILNPGAGEAASAAAAATQSGPGSWLSQLLQAVLNFFKNVFRELSAFLWNLVGTLQQIIIAFITNPAAALVAYAPLLLFAAYEVISPIATYGPMLLALALSLSLGFSSMILPLGEIAPVAVPVAGGTPLVFASTAQSALPVAGMASTVASPAGTPASTAAAGSGAAAAPAPAAATGSFAYIVGGGDPETGFGPTVGGRGGVKAPAATIPAAAAAVPSRAEARSRRRRRAAMRDYGDEFLDMDSDIGVPPDYGDEEQLVSAMASGSGNGRLGFAGTAHKDAVGQAAGLTKLAGDEFGGGPRMPMVPGTWDQDAEGRSEPDESGRGGRDG
jgi:PPE-repeat protein